MPVNKRHIGQISRRYSEFMDLNGCCRFPQSNRPSLQRQIGEPSPAGKQQGRLRRSYLQARRSIFSSVKLLSAVFCVLSLHAPYADAQVKALLDPNEASVPTDPWNINPGNLGVNQAGGLVRPSDTTNALSLNRELGRTSATNQSSNTQQRPLSVTKALGAEELTQFQRFVADVTGHNLSHFGQSLFSSGNAYLADESLPVPANYLLGPGDEVRLQVWGSVDFSAILVIDRNGKAYIPKVGTIPLAGVMVRDLESHLEKQLRRVFTKFQLNANLARLRSVQIYVMGQARQPGALVVSSLSTLVNALFASGGPNVHGSMRNIVLQRNGKTIALLDLYVLIARGDKSQDVSLQAGDVILIPPAGSRVAIIGAFDHEGIYELKDNATSVADLLNLTGGLPSLAGTQKAILERVQSKNLPSREVVEIRMDTQGLQQTLRDADVLTLLPISKAFSNAVTLRGNVAWPLRHAFTPGMRISDLIPDRDALIQADYYRRKNSMVQQLTSAKSERLNNKTAVSQKEADQAVSESRVITEVKNLLEEINWDYAVIERLDAAEVRTQLIPFNLGKAIKTGDPQHNLALQPGDVVTIFGVNDLPVPAEKRSQFVKVGGEVMVPGTYQIQAGETLVDILARAGGLTRHAFSYGMVFTRESTRIQQQVQVDKSLRQMRSEINAQAATQLQNITSDSDKGNIVQAQLAGQRLMLERMQDIKSSGRVSLGLDPDKPVFPPIFLEDGDTIMVPMRPSFVGVFGEVHSESAALYKESSTVMDYLSRAGLTREADIDSTIIIRADGRVESQTPSFFSLRSDILAKRLYPGDSIFVAGRIERRTAYTNFVQGAKDWTAILYQFGLGAVGLKLLSQ
jgi:protein involved in polysaccharide export with SLBB domain